MPAAPTACEAIALDVPRSRLGESPRWSGTTWWWVDAEAGEVWCSPALHAPVKQPLLALGDRVSLVHPALDGDVVIARERSIQRVVASAQGPEIASTWTTVELPAGTVLNDGIADSAGRLWIGAVGPNRRPEEGALIRVDRDGTAHVVANGFSLSNGMAWDRRTRSLLHVDSLARTIWRHRIEPDSGGVMHSEKMMQIGGEGLPDGIALDAAGGLWVAMYGLGQVRRFDPTGRMDVVVHVPTAQTTSVAIGGPDGRDLLITTAQEGFDAARSAAEPQAGRLFTARVQVEAVQPPKARPVLHLSSRRSGY
ncbi:SMP-30/gluconolactonase/LRE family protein [Pseudactinotalea sp. Z1732]|uniref:SMP-30/gluconolactonase/LRE family protein n=1 Tax=Micrococcales TaxID=85006 RepID=UPI003C7DFA1F